jgi:lysophospholipase L1-like esterase
MSFFPSLLTTVGKDLFWVIGDSNADGRGASIPTIAARTLYNWNGASYDEITTQTVANDGAYGSSWQQFAVEYKASFGKPVYLVNSALGGSEFYPNGDTNNWYTSGTLYSAGLADVLAAAAASKVPLKNIRVIICLGINDIRGAQSLTNVVAAMISLVTRINSDLNTPEIYLIQQGRTESVVTNDRAQTVRRTLINLAQDANVHLVTCMLPQINWGYYQVDNLHLSQTGYDLIGTQINRYLVNRGYSKHTRSIIASFKNDVSSVKKAAIEAFVNIFVSPTITGTVDGLFVFVGDNDNRYVDWSLMTVAEPVNSITNASTGVTTNGTNSYIKNNLLNSVQLRSTFTDFCEFVKTGTVTTPGSTSAYLFGKSNSGSSNARTYQGGSALNAQNYDATGNTYVSEIKYANNSIYGIARNGITKMLKKDGSDIISVSQTTVADITTQMTYIGTNNANGTPAAQYINCEYKCYGLLKLSNVTWSTFVGSLNTLLTAME